VLIDGSGIPEKLRDSLRGAVLAAIASQPGAQALSIVLTRLHSGEWTVFITDGMHLELMDRTLTARIVQALKDTERGLRDGVPESDRRLLRAIAALHRPGAREMIPLLEVASRQAGSEAAARTALQRLVWLGVIELAPETGGGLFGRLTDKGADAAALA
jgi:hypothetical protein